MIRWSIQSSEGTVELGARPGDDFTYVMTSESQKHGFAVTEVEFVRSGGVGGRVRSVHVGPQEAVMQIGVQASTEAERETLLRSLSDAVRYDPDQPLPRWVAHYADGSAVQIGFVSRGSGTISDFPASAFALLDLEVSFPHPYWRAVEPVQIRAEFGGGEPLLPEFEKQQVVSSLAATERFVTNPGQVAVPVSWTLTGPANAGASVSINGAGFEFETAIGAGEVREVTVSTDGVSVQDQDGVDRFHELSWLPEFPWLPTGTSQVSIQVTGAQASTTLIGSFFPEFEVVHG